MKKKRLDRDLKWGFQNFPFYQLRLDTDYYHGMVCLIQLVSGRYFYWDLPIARSTAVCGEGMTWLQLLPDDSNRLVTAMFKPTPKIIDGIQYPYSVSAWYIDVIENYQYAPDGVIVYTDKYLDIIMTPQGDMVIDDRDELDEAYASGNLTQAQHQQALEEGEAIVKELYNDLASTEALHSLILAEVNRQIAKGLKPIH